MNKIIDTSLEGNYLYLKNHGARLFWVTVIMLIAVQIFGVGLQLYMMADLMAASGELSLLAQAAPVLVPMALAYAAYSLIREIKKSRAMDREDGLDKI